MGNPSPEHRRQRRRRARDGARFPQEMADGLITFALGESVSLMNIYTQPRRAIRDLKNYEAGAFGRQEASFYEPPQRKWEIGLSPGGFSVAFRF